jgi:hypothetical protein
MSFDTNCNCASCTSEANHSQEGFVPRFSFLIVCPICGSKRCPKAEDHRNDCTGEVPMGIMAIPDQSDKEMFDGEMIEKLKDRVKELEEDLIGILSQINFQLAEPTVNDTGFLVYMATHIEALLPKEKP